MGKNIFCRIVVLFVLVAGGSTVTYGEPAQYAITQNYYNWDDDLNARVKEEFGSGATVADWTEIKANYGDSVEHIKAFCDNAGLLLGENALVTVNGVGLWPADPRRHYYVERNNSEPPSNPNFLVHDDIQNHYLDLGSWWGIRRILVKLPALMVLDPNGGEILTAGDTYTISWSSIGSIDNVLIEYSTDNGSNWTTIDTVSNTGSYDWLVPAVNSSQCLVRVSDLSNPSIGDISDDTFTIFREPIIYYVDNDAVNDPEPNDPHISDPCENGSPEHPFDAIQEAIDFVVDGDIIVVGPGTYTGTGNRDIDFKGKAITIRSTDPNDPCVVEATIIDCQGTEDDPHRGFYLHSGEDTNSVLSGLTITNGYAEYGGAILCESESGLYISSCYVKDTARDSSIYGLRGTLKNCIIINNNWSSTCSSPQIDGGGLCNCSGQMINCKVIKNYAEGYGGGLYGCNFIMIDCNVSGNKTNRQGGGLYDCNVVMINCVINNNRGYEGVGGISFCDVNMTLCTVNENIGPRGYEHEGGGISDCTGEISNCTFQKNVGAWGGGISRFSGNIINCVISDNNANWSGGGIYAGGCIQNCIISNNRASCGGGLDHCSGPIVNCIISGNTAGTGGGLCSCGLIHQCTIVSNSASCDRGGGLADGRAKISNCIIWDNTAAGMNRNPFCYCESSQLSYSCVQDMNLSEESHWPICGAGNIDNAPCFVNPDQNDYHLLSNSPCIDAGDPDYILDPNYPTDLDGNPRVVGSRIDMGAYEFQSPELRYADLVVTSEDLTFKPLPGKLGQDVNISATISNIGDGSASNIQVGFSDANGPLNSAVIPLIAPDDSNTVSIQYAWQQAGFYLVTVSVSTVGDSDLSNNTASKLYQVGDVCNMEAFVEVVVSMASSFQQGYSGSLCGTATYKVIGQQNVVYPVEGGRVSVDITERVSGNLIHRYDLRTDNSGRFTLAFPVPGTAGDVFDVNVAVTDGSMAGSRMRSFEVVNLPPVKDLWVGNMQFEDDTPDVGAGNTATVTVYAAADNNETVYNIPVTFYAYNMSLGTATEQISSTNYIDSLSPGETTEVSVVWTLAIEGTYRISASLAPGYSDDRNYNNSTSRSITVGPFTVSVSPLYAGENQVVTITLNSRWPLPSDALDTISIKDKLGADILLDNNPIEHVPGSTKWICRTQPLTDNTALGRASITVSGTDSNGISHDGYGYFTVIDVLADLFLTPCDLLFSNLNPALGETITLTANITADSSNLYDVKDIPVTFYAKHGSGSEYKIGSTQYIDSISAGETKSVSLAWTNAASDVYFMRAVLEPGYSDAINTNNSETRGLVVGDLPFQVKFVVVEKTRVGRTTFDYECKVELTNKSELGAHNLRFEIVSAPANMLLIDTLVEDFAMVGSYQTVLSQDTCKFRVERSDAIASAELDWKIDYEIVDLCQPLQQLSSTLVILDNIQAGDITGDGKVNFEDLYIMARDWLKDSSIADIFPPPNGDNMVDFKDFGVLAENWLEE